MAPGSVLIKVDAATLCGTDAHRWMGHLSEGRPRSAVHRTGETCPTRPATKPAAPSWKPAAPVTDILNQPLKPGDRIISSYSHCGHCYYCRVTRQTTLCHANTSFGHSHPTRSWAAAPSIITSRRAARFIRVPETVAPELAASAACALRTMMHSFEQLGGIASHERC